LALRVLLCSTWNILTAAWNAVGMGAPVANPFNAICENIADAGVPHSSRVLCGLSGMVKPIELLAEILRMVAWHPRIVVGGEAEAA
jgi:hypothetical protein